MLCVRSFLFSVQRLHNCNGFMFACRFDRFRFCLSKFKPPYEVIDARIGSSTIISAKTMYSNYSQSNFTSLLWYSSKTDRPFRRAYRKRVNRRLRLANKPVLNEARFNEAISQLPARFDADDLHGVIASEDNSLVCLELFNWASRQHRFKHSVDTYHITIQKLGVGGMIEEMYDVVDQALALPHFGSEPLYNTVIYYFTQARKLSRAITVFKHMKKAESLDCRPSIISYNLLFGAFLSRRRDSYISHWYMGTMECLFRQMIKDGIDPDIFSLNSMIQGYVLSNHINDALRMFHQMGVVYSCVPNAITYDNLIHGLCGQARTKNARELLSQMKERGFVASAKTYNSLVCALAIDGEVEEALSFLWEMIDKQILSDLITYKTLLDEFCRKGRAADAFTLVKELKMKKLVNEHKYKMLLSGFQR